MYVELEGSAKMHYAGDSKVIITPRIGDYIGPMKIRDSGAHKEGTRTFRSVSISCIT